MCDDVTGPLVASLLSITVFRSLTKRSVDRKVKFGGIVFQIIICDACHKVCHVLSSVIYCLS